MNAKKSERSQSDKFKEAARDLGADGDEEALDKALKKMKRGREHAHSEKDDDG